MSCLQDIHTTEVNYVMSAGQHTTETYAHLCLVVLLLTKAKRWDHQQTRKDNVIHTWWNFSSINKKN